MDSRKTDRCFAAVDACKAAGRTLMIACRLQHTPEHRTIIGVAGNKQFGAVRMTEAVNGRNDMPDGRCRQIKALAGGGSLLDVRLYCLHALRDITGEKPIEVTGRLTQPKGNPRCREIEDIAMSTLRFPSGIVASGISADSFHESRLLRSQAGTSSFKLDPAFGYDDLNLATARRDRRAKPGSRRFRRSADPRRSWTRSHEQSIDKTAIFASYGE